VGQGGGEVERRGDQLAQRLGGVPDGRLLRLRLPGVRDPRALGRRRVEQQLVEVGAGDPVDHAVVDLGQQGPASLGEAVPEGVLPQRSVAVHPGRHQPAHQLRDLRTTAGGWYRDLPQVVVDVEVRVVDPGGRGQAERHRPEPLAVTRDQRETTGDGGDDLVEGGRRTGEDRERADGQRRVPVHVLCLEEGVRQGGQSLHRTSVPFACVEPPGADVTAARAQRPCGRDRAEDTVEKEGPTSEER
jgi:hypothetical protein